MGEILVKHYIKRQIMEALGTTYPTIKRALDGKRMNELALRIREKALELGGVEAKDND
ncbi:MAG: hypothetical protein LBQ74_15140 [Prevotella sp.]|jgi:hypothetical protein|nr:hypothetical protein [Prevotella sp.]